MMDPGRLVDLLLNRPSTPLAWDEESLEGWEPVETPEPEAKD